MTRVRTSSFGYAGGGKAILYNGAGPAIINQTTRSPFTLVSSTCSDDVGYPFDHPLSIVSFRKDGIQYLNGFVTNLGNKCEYINYPASWQDVAVNHLIDTLPSDGAIGTRAKALTNPSRPYVSVPNFIYELKDLPGMLRDIGRLKLRYEGLGTGWRHGRRTARQASNHYLSYQMGWAPLISDVQKLLDFQARVDRKIRDLEHLFVQKRGLSKSVSSKTGGWSQVLESSSTVTIDSYFGTASIISVISKKTKVECWATCRWTSTALPSTRYSSKQLAAMARDLVFGLNVNPKAIWDAVPWTWLVGWFTNVDDFLSAHTNVIPVQCGLVNVMRHTSTEELWKRTSARAAISGGYGTRSAEIKSRSLQTGTLSATLPFISARQFAILEALAIQRVR
jgi:hypothetical protein